MSDLGISADTLLALEPEELALRMLPLLAKWPTFYQFDVANVSNNLAGNYQPHERRDIKLALAEAYAWLQGQGLIISDLSRPGSQRLGRKAERLARSPNLAKAMEA